jgi:nucleoside-diphosphate-sugar epimerase
MHTPNTEEQLDILLAKPSEQLIELIRNLPGDITILGANGKMGLSQSFMAKQAIEKAGVKKCVYAVSRFTDKAGRDKLESWGVKTVTCDLLDVEQVKKLPVTENVLFMAGRKFGTTGSEPLTWAMNALVPANCAAHYKGSRTVVFSTGCVYALVKAETGGSKEADRPEPVGEYAQSCLCRERIFEHFSLTDKTPVVLFRLNYATDLRYGVLYDIGIKVWNNEPVITGVDYFNILWQGDANNYALLALQKTDSPAAVLNITGEGILSVRDVAEEMGAIMKRPVRIVSEGLDHSYLNDASKSFRYFGKPSISSNELIRMQAEWIMCGGRGLNKPTHFEVEDGRF